MSEHESKSGTHILSLRTYLGIGFALLLLTVVTVAVSFIHLGGWNAVVAVGIASLKAALVALFFMHLLYDKKINLVIFLIALLFLALFITLTMFDVLRRGDIYEASDKPIIKRAVIYDKPAADTLAAPDTPDTLSFQDSSDLH